MHQSDRLSFVYTLVNDPEEKDPTLLQIYPHFSFNLHSPTHSLSTALQNPEESESIQID